MLHDGKKELPPERYDSKLFQQAYRAGLKAKELDKQKAERDRRRKYILYVSLVPIIFIVFLILKPKEPEKYISSNLVSQTYASITLPDTQSSSVLGMADVNISAKTALVYSTKTNKAFFKKNELDKVYPASLTKLVTAMVMIDTYGLDYDLEITKEVPDDFGWALGLQKGDIINTKQLLDSMIISSYNDAAFVVANEYGYEEFVEKMNSKIKLLGCNSTHFENPTGLHDDNHYTTSKDFQKIMNAVLRYPSILELGGLFGNEITWISEGNIKTEYIYTTNKLIGDISNVKGLKTGYTEEAGQCLITIYENKTDQYIVILMGSQDRFGETKKILNSLN